MSRDLPEEMDPRNQKDPGPLILLQPGLTADMVNHPPHYARLKPEPIDVMEAWNLPHHLACALKYIARWDAKGGVTDLRKAVWYIERFVELKEKS